jgi:hypothetical protein
LEGAIETSFRAGRRNEADTWQEVLKQLTGIGKAIDEAKKRADKQQQHSHQKQKE